MREPAHARDEQRTARSGPDPARAGVVHQEPSARFADADERVRSAHHERERTTAHHVEGAALHEQRIAEDGHAVPDPGDDAADRGDPDVGAHRGREIPDRHHSDARSVDRGDAGARKHRRAHEAAEHEPGAHRAEEKPEAEVAGREGVLGEEHLRDVHQAGRERGDSPGDEHGAHRRRAERRPKAVAEVAPVAARECPLALQQTGGNADHEHDRDGERDGIDRVGSRRPRHCGERAADERPDRPAHVLDRLEQGVRSGQICFRHEVGNAGVHGRTEEAGRQARDERQSDDHRGARRERQRREHADPQARRRRSSASAVRAGRGAARAGGRRRSSAGTRR